MANPASLVLRTLDSHNSFSHQPTTLFTTRMLPSRIICQAWFKPDVVDHGYHHCICGMVCQQDIKAGYTGLLQHPKAANNGCEIVTNPNGTLQPAIAEFLKLDKSDSLDK
ncbi:hypothetical protein JG687_00009007 [Phytophthora cactorum]|uniref:Uncharacterized protein n=2 Tax=Phytophthora cactorum TaxID=29920 RepID=A0A329SBK9_9STRA|nr:hypothetical protein PC128_g18273 [Phytophthora cactorum]KAG4056726.1 hypothetical protein PC123_g8229 [Phytophthora cactorum]KAG6959083.1 hypothetical protein JG687_00009007 [Phytophthora cactorum]RAW34277.1 hypothetical protein PC110_g9394 [Phytophthora cactorum]